MIAFSRQYSSLSRSDHAQAFPRGCAAATILATPLLAQAIDPETGRTATAEQQRGYVGVPSPAEPAVDAAQKPVTAALNGQVAAADAAASNANAALSADQQAQYDADRAQYIDALVRHDAAVNRTDARYVRQQRAYADAMSVWRVQVAECKKGRQSACRMPPPNVADYY